VAAFVAGLAYPFRAFGTIQRSTGLWMYILAPILINIIVGAALYAGLLVTGFAQIEAIIGGLPEWAQGIAGLLRVLLAILLFIAVGYLLVRFGVVLGSPFYGQLSERLEYQLTGSAPPAEPLSLVGVLHDISRSLLYELKKFALVLAIGLPLLLLGFLPVVGQIAGLLGQIALGALITCLDFIDSPLERRRLRFREKLATIRQALPATAGFGLICLGLVSIPLINLLAIPLCVVAGTLLFCERCGRRGAAA
jgi:CysZ protein